MVEAQMHHAPGPWRIGEHRDIVAAGRGCTDGGDIVCLRPFPELGASQAYWDANARLIAAAPELLAVLKATEVWLALSGSIAEKDDALAVIRAVIAKAEGVGHG